MTDTKPRQVDTTFLTVPAGSAFHDMRIVMTVDAALRILSVAAHTGAGPTPYCAEINPAYSSLEGLRIGPGFKSQVKARVGGTLGCTHLTQLLDTMATTAVQAMVEHNYAEARLRQELNPEAPMPKPWVIDTCHSYRMDGEAVNILWPESRRPKLPDAG
jgi:hypothetical protein